MNKLTGVLLLGLLGASTLASATQVFTGNLANHNDFGGGFFSVSEESNVTLWTNSANFDVDTGFLGNFDHFLTLWKVEGSNATVIQTANNTLLLSGTPIDPSQDFFDEVLQTVLGVGNYAFAITAVDELGNANSPIISFTNSATGTSADNAAYAWGSEIPVPWEFWTDPPNAGNFATGYSYQVGNFWQVNVDVNPVPVPGAVWLFGSALAGFVGVGRKKRV